MAGPFGGILVASLKRGRGNRSSYSRAGSPDHELALSRRKQGFESPRERQRNQWLNGDLGRQLRPVRKIYGKAVLTLPALCSGGPRFELRYFAS
jgi:hypothetical protein